MPHFFSCSYQAMPIPWPSIFTILSAAAKQHCQIHSEERIWGPLRVETRNLHEDLMRKSERVVRVRQCSLTITTAGSHFSLHIMVMLLTPYHYRQEVKRKQDTLNSRCLQRIGSVRHPRVTTSHLYKTGSQLWEPDMSPRSRSG